MAKTELLVNAITRSAGNEETIILEGLLHSGLGNRTWTGGEMLSLLGERRGNIYMTILWEHRNENIGGATFEMALIILGVSFNVFT